MTPVAISGRDRAQPYVGHVMRFAPVVLALAIVGIGCAPAATPSTSMPNDLWRTAELSDVRSGQAVVVNELVAAGQLVVIEPMAIWCTTCRVQQNEARAALAELSRDDIVYVSLGVDPNETAAELARYADESDYPWHFVVASRDVARSLAQAFGDQVLSPPSTPKIVVARDGQAEVSFGIKRAEQLKAELAALLP
jgi:cytochrome oxidase Cu insertion factor (SCO1/SenC/PrrC family)